MVEIMYRGLHSCIVSNPIDIPFESCFYEPNTKPHCEENSYKTNQSGWNFLQALSNVSKDKESSTNTYVHPQLKYSSVRLSPKSLELCTENLGNETGSDDIMDNEVELLSYSPCFSWECVEKKKGSKIMRGENEKEKRKNFPPPLTTIRGGSECLKMMPCREGGRLVIEVTKLQPTGSCFQAERSQGRLRLSFLRNPMEEEEQEEEEEEEEDDDDDENEEELENEMIRESRELQEEIEDLEEEEEKEEEAELEGHENENERDKSGNSWNIRIMEKYDRKGRRSRSRCNEENNGFGIAVVNFLTA